MLSNEKLESYEKAIGKSLKQGGKDGHCAMVQVMPHDLLQLINDSRDFHAFERVVEATPPKFDKVLQVTAISEQAAFRMADALEEIGKALREGRYQHQSGGLIIDKQDTSVSVKSDLVLRLGAVL